LIFTQKQDRHNAFFTLRGFYVRKSQRAAQTTQKNFLLKNAQINLEDDFEQKVFLSNMRYALGFSNMKSSLSFLFIFFPSKPPTAII